MQNLAGQTIKGYELRECLGMGGFGAVYKAYQAAVGREVAIKIILPGLASQPDFIRRFETEAHVIARLEHACIVPLYDYWRDPDGAYLVMRWLRGGSLSDVLKRGALDLETIARILDQVASALALAHRSNIIHRDIKPGNMLLDEDNNAYLADFGIAKDLKSIEGSGTQMDAIVGSLDYMSPEQARSEPVTSRTDIYSLGVVLYEMLVGEHPFPNMTSVERLYKHINDPLPLITTLDDSIQDSINEVIRKATAKNPQHRHEDVLQMALAFKEAAGLNRTLTGSTVVELLTLREQEVLRLLMTGAANKDIAGKLFITVPTVKWYLNEIFRKLRVRSRVQAIVRARELNLIVPAGETTDETVPSVSLSNLPEPENPYKGLRAFQAADERDFFGREEFVQKLLKRMTSSSTLTKTDEHHRFLAVVGPSGSGKSSVVKAGLIPALLRGGLPRSERWFVVEMLPGSHPFDELEVALLRIAPGHAQIRGQLGRDERGLLRAAQLLLPQDDSELVIVIDQFEEVFTLVEDETIRANFLNMLLATAAAKRSRIHIIVTLRADFYDRPLNYPEFGDLLRDRMETILPLSAKGLERAILEPARHAGVIFEDGLVATIVADVNYQAGALPLLQYALTELFEQRSGRMLTHEAYHSIGGAVGALAKRAEAIYQELSAEAQSLTRQLFLRLVTLGEGVEDTRRRTARTELVALANPAPPPLYAVERGEDRIDEIIDTYAEYRLLALDHDPATRTPTIEVAHEALLREWERLRGWLNESRSDIRLQQQLSASAAEWTRARHDESYLLTGARLAQFEAWSKETGLALTPSEHTYLNASLTRREREMQAEHERQSREIHLEQRSRNFLRALVGVFAAATVIALFLMGIAMNESTRANAAVIAAEVERDTAETERDTARTLALVNGAQAALQDGNMDQAIALALHLNTPGSLSNLSDFTLSKIVYAPGTIRRFIGHESDVNSVAFSTDGRMAVTASADKTVILWDVATGEILHRLEGHHAAVESAAFSPDGQMLVSGGRDRALILWNTTTGTVIREFEGSAAMSVAFSPDGKTILAGLTSGGLALWDVASGQMIQHFIGHRFAVNSVAFSPDGKTAVAGSGGEGIPTQPELILWDVTTGEALRRFSGHIQQIQSVAFSPDGHSIVSAAGGQDGGHELILWDVQTGEEIRRFWGHQLQIWSVAFSPDGQRILSGSQDNTMILWNVNTGEQIQHFQGHTGIIYSVAFSPDGRTALSGSMDGTARHWELIGGALKQDFKGHQNWVWDIALSPDQSTLAASSRDGSLRLWNVLTGEPIQQLEKMPGEGRGLVFAPDGRSVFVNDGTGFQQIETKTGNKIRRFTGHGDSLADLVLSPDGSSMISASYDTTLILWDIKTGELIRRFRGHTGAALSVRFSPDGSKAISTSSDSTVLLWDVATGEIIYRMEGHGGWIWSVNFSPDGTMALSGGDDALILWDLASGKEIRRFQGHSGPVGGVVFMPDGQHALSSSVDRTVILWDMVTGEILRRFEGPDATIKITLAHDGRTVFAAYGDGHVLAWRIDSHDEITAWAQTNRYIPELTCDQRALYRLEPLCAEDETSG